MLRANDCWDDNAHKHITEYSSNMLWRFIQPNAKESGVEETFLNLTGLRKRDLDKLVDIRFLLSDSTRKLVNEIAPKIINRLSKESVNEHITDRGRVRGRIDWQKTINTRAANGNDPSIYVYSRRSQVYDLPENRLFLYMIKQINEKAKNLVSEDYININWYVDINDVTKWIDKVSVIASKTAKLLRNPYILKIGNLYELTDRIVELTSKNRQAYYKELSGLAERFLYSQRSPVSYLKEELKGNILEPISKDTLFEIAVLFNTIQTAIDCGWVEKKAGLIGGGGKTVSTLIKNKYEMKVYFQKLPEVMAANSGYGEIMNNYGLSEKLRRPDIIIEVSDSQNTEFFIVEVKRSKSRKYLVDGTYKLLGYLKDFEKAKESGCKIFGVLVGWKGIANIDCDFSREVNLLNWDNYHIGLKELFNK